MDRGYRKTNNWEGHCFLSLMYVKRFVDALGLPLSFTMLRRTALAELALHEQQCYLRSHVAVSRQYHVAVCCKLRLQGVLPYAMGKLAPATTCNCPLHWRLVVAVRLTHCLYNGTICASCCRDSLRSVVENCDRAWHAPLFRARLLHVTPSDTHRIPRC